MTAPARPEAVGRILIVRPSALGDVARTAPALVTLRKAYPDARIDWLVASPLADVIAHHRDLNHIVPFPRNRFGSLWRRPSVAAEALCWASQLRKAQYDLVVDLQGLLRSGVFTWLTRAPRRVGFANAREMAHRAYNRRHTVGTQLHTVDRMLKLLELEGYAPQRDMRLYVSDGDQHWWKQYRTQHRFADQPYFVVAPSARWRCKCWPIDRYIEIAKRLVQTRHAGEKCVILAAADERKMVQPLVHALGDSALLPTTTVGQMMSVIQHANLLIGNDSSPLHIAVGLDTPLTAIFGPTDPAIVGPYGRDDCVIQPPHIDRQTMAQYRRHRDDQSLISQVSIESVWRNLQTRVGVTAL